MVLSTTIVKSFCHFKPKPQEKNNTKRTYNQKQSPKPTFPSKKTSKNTNTSFPINTRNCPSNGNSTIVQFFPDDDKLRHATTNENHPIFFPHRSTAQWRTSNLDTDDKHGWHKKARQSSQYGGSVMGCQMRNTFYNFSTTKKAMGFCWQRDVNISNQ